MKLVNTQHTSTFYHYCNSKSVLIENIDVSIFNRILRRYVNIYYIEINIV